MLLITLTMLIWIVTIQEFIKPSKEQNGRKIAILTAFGTLLTLVLTVSYFRSSLF